MLNVEQRPAYPKRRVRELIEDIIFDILAPNLIETVVSITFGQRDSELVN